MFFEKVDFLFSVDGDVVVAPEWNDGAELHWREWTPLIPYVGFIFSVWNGLDCYNGMTAHQWAEKNGANWY